MPLKSGLLFANPIPLEFSLSKVEMDVFISQAIQEAESAGYHGSKNTPFVLKRIRELTQGGSVNANRALIDSNVARGSKVALELSKLQMDSGGHAARGETKADQVSIPAQNIGSVSLRPPHLGALPSPKHGSSARELHAVEPLAIHDLNGHQAKNVKVVVAGSLAIDLSCDLRPAPGSTASLEPSLHTSNPASIKQTLGGVSRNVASALQFMGVNTRLCSKVGVDIAGKSAIAMLEKQGLQTSGILLSESGASTAQYVAINNARKDLVIAMADMDILQNTVSDRTESKSTQTFSEWAGCNPEWLIVDANWDPNTLHAWLQTGKELNAKVAYEPVSVAKSGRLFGTAGSDGACNADNLVFPNIKLDLATPNSLELAEMHKVAKSMGLMERDDWFEVIDAFRLSSSGSRDLLVRLTNSSMVDRGIPQQAIQLLPFIPTIVTTLGEEGALLTQILLPNDDRLTSPETAPYLLSRPMKGTSRVGGVYMRLYLSPEIIPKQDVVSVNGVGDTFLGALIAGMTLSKNSKVEDVIDIAQRASILTLKSSEAVSPSLASLRSAMPEATDN